LAVNSVHFVISAADL